MSASSDSASTNNTAPLSAWRLCAVVAATVLLTLSVGRASAAVTYTVTSATDDGTGATPGTLSYAIAQADATSGSTIAFAPGVTQVTLTGAMTPQITSAVTIDGGTAGVAIDGANAYRPFYVNTASATTAVNFSNLTIQNGLAQGGNGGTGGGGGGAGLGGAIFVNGGAVTTTNVNFTNDNAIGGNGTAIGKGGGGGGGVVGSGGAGTTTAGGGGGGTTPGSVGTAGGGSGGTTAGASGTSGSSGGGGGGGAVGANATARFATGGTGGGGGAGGFGGGGGAGGQAGNPGYEGNNGQGGNGGAGGFGGGGGGSSNYSGGGNGGYGGGNGSYLGGGGGAAFGGAVFVNSDTTLGSPGASFTLAGGTMGTGTVTAGSTANSSDHATAAGGSIFLNGGGPLAVNLTPTQSQTLTGSVASHNNTGGLNLTGGGTLTLSAGSQNNGSSPYGGNFSVASSTLINNSEVGGNVNVTAGGTVGGTGLFDGDATLTHSTLFTGLNGPIGPLVVNNFSMDASSTANFALGTNSDQVDAISDVTVNGLLNVSAGPGFGAGTYVLVDFSSTGDPLGGSGFTLGSLPAGYTYQLVDDENNYQYDLVVSAPEPASLGLLAIGSLGLLARRRRTDAIGAADKLA